MAKSEQLTLNEISMLRSLVSKRLTEMLGLGLYTPGIPGHPESDRLEALASKLRVLEGE